MVTFQVEKWADCVGEMRDIWPEHWESLALNREVIKLDVDEAKYEQGEAMGCLHVVTARADGKLVGYFYGMLMNHLHYKSSGLMCYTDVYYLKPAFRKGATGIRFISAVMASLKAIGVVKFYISTKMKADNSQVLQSLGMKVSDVVLTKML